MMKAMFVFLIILSIFSQSCKEQEDETMINNELLGHWRLNSLIFKHDDSIKSYPDTLDKDVLIEFTDSLVINLIGYCNVGKASYFLKDNYLTIDKVSLTEKACPYSGGYWEEHLYKLSSVTSFELIEEEFKLHTNLDVDFVFIKED